MRTEPEAAPERKEMDDRPPVLGSWRSIYLVVLGNLLLMVVLFWVLTKVYA
jgi:hypothetical protein